MINIEIRIDMDTDKALLLEYVLYACTHVRECVCVCVYMDACVCRHIYVYMLEIAYMYPARTGSEGKPAQAGPTRSSRRNSKRRRPLRMLQRPQHALVDFKPVQTEQRMPARHSHAHRRHGCTAAQRVPAGLGEHM